MFFLKELKIKDFRCYKSQNFTFFPQKNVFIGKNAVGKTSAVEAIYFLSFAKSFRTSKEQELIKKDSENLYLEAKFETNTGTETLEIAYDGKKRSISLNGKVVRTVSSLVGRFCAVVFCPDDLNIIKLEPQRRRKLIDISICQIDKAYLIALSQIKRIYKEKSTYLHTYPQENADYDYVRALNSEFIRYSTYIIRKRREFIMELDALAKGIVKSLGISEEIKLNYIPNTEEENLVKAANDKIGDDVAAKTTTWGPLRDDLGILINGQNAQSGASQGQIRTAAIAIKLALVKYYKSMDKNIIVILDDALSELDKDRQNALFAHLGKDNQVFITATDIKLIEDVQEDTKIINL